MNWGKGLIVGMSLFMLFIVVLVVRMFTIPADEYDHHYYEKGLNFDADYKRERQVLLDNATPIIHNNNNNLLIKFTAPAKGIIKFIRPANQQLDRDFPINSGANDEVSTPIMAMQSGKWQLLLTWKSNHKEYRYQQDIYLK
ncbi:MAG: FixH family protein [Bacteroidota bacterium]